MRNSRTDRFHRVFGIRRTSNGRVNFMNSHAGEDMKGRVKEAAGDLTGDADLKREGQIDQASAATKKAIDDVADALKDAVSPKE